MRSKFPKHVPDADLPTTPLGSLWVAPPKSDSEQGGGGEATESAGPRDGTNVKAEEHQALRNGSTDFDKPAEAESPASGTGAPCIPGHGASEPPTAAGVPDGHAGERRSGGPCDGVGGRAAAAARGGVVGGATVAETAAGGKGSGRSSCGEPPAQEALNGDGGSGGGGARGASGASGNSNKKTKKKDKKKNRMGGGNGGGGPPTSGDLTEIDYCGILNRVLPPDVRALAWAPVTEGFSARFSCSDRTYR